MATAALAGLILADRAGWGFYQGPDLSRYDGKTFRVAGVIDGDTLELAIKDGERPTTRVRLWGIDAPEVARDGRPSEPFADDATDRAQTLAYGTTVKLSLEPHRLRGRYGRLLAYVTLPDGTVLNERLLAEGLARAEDRWPHRAAGRYAQLEAQARHEGRGLWLSPLPGIVSGPPSHR
ncbi:MAG: thermonuclease family protein [Planctomycetota bacterium]